MILGLEMVPLLGMSLLMVWCTWQRYCINHNQPVVSVSKMPKMLSR